MNRIVYMMESIDNNGTLIYRLFAANKKTVEKLKRKHSGAPDPIVRALTKDERDWINPSDIERL